MPLLPGGLADQPIGYLADVMKVRAYSRAKEAMDRAADTGSDGQVRFPPPEWARSLCDAVRMRIDEMALDELE